MASRTGGLPARCREPGPDLPPPPARGYTFGTMKHIGSYFFYFFGFPAAGGTSREVVRT